MPKKHKEKEIKHYSEEEIKRFANQSYDLDAVRDEIEYYSRETVSRIIETTLAKSKKLRLPDTPYKYAKESEAQIPRQEFAYRTLNEDCAANFHFSRKAPTTKQMAGVLKALLGALKDSESLLLEPEKSNVERLLSGEFGALSDGDRKRLEDSPELRKQAENYYNIYPPAESILINLKGALFKHTSGPNHTQRVQKLKMATRAVRDLRGWVGAAYEEALNAPDADNNSKPEFKDFVARLYWLYRELFNIQDYKISENGPAVKFVRACLEEFPFEKVKEIEKKNTGS